MKKTNRILLFFISSLFVLIMALWSIVQSEVFGSISSNYIGSYVFKKHNIKLSFDRFNFSVVPLSTSLVNFSIENKDVRLDLDELKISFGLRDLISKTISIGEVELKDGILVSKVKSEENNPRNYNNIGDLYKEIDLFYRVKTPVKIRGVSVKNIIFFHDSKKIDINSMKVIRFSNSFNIEGENALKSEMYEKFLSKSLSKLKLDGVKYRLKFSNDGLKIETLILKNKSDYVSVSGEIGSNKNVKKLFFDAAIDLVNYKSQIRNLLGDNSLNLMGQTKIKGAASGGFDNLNINLDVEAENIVSKFISINKGAAILELDENVLAVNDANGSIGKGTFKLKEKFTLADFNKKNNKVSADMLLDLNNVFSNDVLVFVKPLSDLDVYISGETFLAIDTNRVKVEIREDNDFSNLTFGKRNKPLFKIDRGSIQKGSSVVARYNDKTDIDLKLMFGSSEVNAKGWISKDSIDISYASSFFSFEDAGPIAGVALGGVGRLNGKVLGPLEDVVFKTIINKRDASILNFNLSNITSSFDYHLKNNELKIKELLGSHNTVTYKSSGTFNFGTNEGFNLKVDINKGRYSDVAHILAPILKVAKETTDSFNLKALVAASAEIDGTFNLSEINAKGSIRATEISVYGEDVEYLETPFKLEKNLVKFDKVRGKKSSGIISASASYNIYDKSYTYQAELRSMRVRDFYYYRLSNLGLDGFINLNTSGMGDENNFSSKNTMSIEDSQIDNVKINDSLFTFHNNNEDVFFNGDLIGGEVKANGYINLHKSNKKRSKINVEANTKRINEYLGILSLHNINKRNLMGSVSFKTAADFNINNLKDLNFKTVITNAYFKYADIILKKKDEDLLLLIENGQIVDWNAEVIGKSASVRSIGLGSLGKDFNIRTDFDLSASFFELVSDTVENARGKVQGVLEIKEEENQFQTKALVSGDSLRLKISQVRGVLSDGRFTASLEDNSFRLLESSLSYGNGVVKTKGSVDFLIPFPNVSFESRLDKVALPILKKSNVTVSGELSLIGERFPYSLKGAVEVEDGNILEGMQELAATAATAEGYKRFLPIGYSKGGASPLLMNIDTKIKSPILIKNGMIDIGLAGEVNIFGTPLNPSFNGDLNVVGQESKLIFKGHEFILQGGEIRLLDNRSKEKPELDFTGVAKVNEYSIFVTLNGAVDKLAIELNSNPSLAQEDILSLLTLGVTSDVSKNLTEGEMQSVTNLSIGSLIVDQLKINQTLNDSLGLRLSVQPEFQENEDNLLVGRSEDSSNERRLRSTTRVKVYKKINKNVNMSISSTLGGTVDQTQEMNINYRVNDNFSLEGIYQKQAGEEIDAETPDSIGADLKWQWFF